jgi:hypothetical protein
VDRSFLMPLLVACLALAGCASPATDAPTGEDASRDAYDAIEAAIGAPVEAGHDHMDPALHEGSYNLDLVALVKGEEGRVPQPTESYVETAVKGGYAYLCRTGPDQGLVVFDISDIEKPTQVGYLKLEAGFEPDIEVSDDGMWGFWETQRFPTSAEVPSVTDPGANLHRGVHIVDLSDKANPRWAGFSPTTPDGPHSITYANISGRHVLFQSVYAFAYAYGDAEVPGQQRLIVSELDTSLPLAQLKTLAEYVEPGATGGPGLFPHDVSVQTHPVTGQVLAYVAYWDVGVVILDVTDPASPRKVGVATDFGPAGYRAVHMARAFPHLIDGRHVTVVEPEIGAEPDSGYVTFLDTTDPANPTYLSSWLLPGNLTSEGGALGPHYFDVADGRVALASYHAGFWVIDVHNAENLMRPRTVAYALVNATGQALPGPAGGLGAGSSAFDAWWYEGYVVAGDVHGGLAVYRYTGPAPAPVA